MPGQLDGAQNQEHQQQLMKRDVRTVITFFTLFVTLVGLTAPLYVQIIVVAIVGMNHQPHIGVQYLVTDFYHLLPIADAFILSWNKDIKEAIKNAMRKCVTIWHSTQ